MQTINKVQCCSPFNSITMSNIFLLNKNSITTCKQLTKLLQFNEQHQGNVYSIFVLNKKSIKTCKQLTKFNAPVQWTASQCPVYLCSNIKCGIVFIWLLTPKQKYWIKRKYLLFLNWEERIGYLMSSSQSPFLNISWSIRNILQFILVYESQTNIPFKNSSTFEKWIIWSQLLRIEINSFRVQVFHQKGKNFSIINEIGNKHDRFRLDAVWELKEWKQETLVLNPEFMEPNEILMTSSTLVCSML